MKNSRMKISVTVKPNAKQTQITNTEINRYIATIKAPPKDGKANDALVKALATFFKVPQSYITIEKGHSGKEKLVTINGL